MAPLASHRSVVGVSNQNPLPHDGEVSEGLPTARSLHVDELFAPVHDGPEDLGLDGQVLVLRDADEAGDQVVPAKVRAAGPEDLDGSGVVDVDDVIQLLRFWGECP